MDDTILLGLSEEQIDDAEDISDIGNASHEKDFGQRKYIHISNNSSGSSTSLGGGTQSGSVQSSSSNGSTRNSAASSPRGLLPSSKSAGSLGSGSSSASYRLGSASPTSPTSRSSSGSSVARPTAFAKWVQSHQSSQKESSTPTTNTTTSSSPNMRSLNKQWVHPPDALVKGHIVYNVKFLGETEVEQPKGTDVVRDAIRKMKFSRHIKKAEGHKSAKVEITVSADGVTIQDPKTKMIMHQYPLHRISYCADDKADKRMFTFIAKAGDSNKHFCYVFDSEKCAEEITLTVGQAFDLAYRRFLETSGKDMDQKKQHLLLQKKVQTLQQENDELKKRLTDVSKLKDRADLEQYKQANRISDLTAIGSPSSAPQTVTNNNSCLPQSPVSPQTATSSASKPVVGRRLENLVFEDNFINGNTHHNNTQAPLLSPPPPSGKTRSYSMNSITSPGTPPASQTPPLGQQPPASAAAAFCGYSSPMTYHDPFGMGAFTPSQSPQDLDTAIQKMDRELLDLQSGFSRGISFGTDDFSLEDLDPLNQK